MTGEEALKLFEMNRALFEADIRRIEAEYGIQVLRSGELVGDADESFYSQFPAALRESATAMAEHYETFYCMENYLRDLVVDQLKGVHGNDWWETDDPRVVVPPVVKESVARNIQRERDAGVTLRSADLIDYTTFGELSTIIDSNWDSFGDIFNSRKGLNSVLARLNLLRGPIAHCSELSADEVVRLRLTLADWFRLMS